MVAGDRWESSLPVSFELQSCRNQPRGDSQARTRGRLAVTMHPPGAQQGYLAARHR